MGGQIDIRLIRDRPGDCVILAAVVVVQIFQPNPKIPVYCVLDSATDRPPHMRGVGFSL